MFRLFREFELVDASAPDEFVTEIARLTMAFFDGAVVATQIDADSVDLGRMFALFQAGLAPAVAACEHGRSGAEAVAPRRASTHRLRGSAARSARAVPTAGAWLSRRCGLPAGEGSRFGDAHPKMGPLHPLFTSACYPSRCMRVLVVEDEPVIADFIVRGLTEQGYAVDLARDGAAALELADPGSFDVILLDIMLPKVDGLTVCRRLRERGNKTPVLMLTARDTVDDRVRGLDSGADDYLVKPFAFAELVARVRALSRRVPGLTDTVLRVADLELDTATRSARRGDRGIELTTKEYALLEYLMRNPNRVLTRTMITDRVWNYDTLNLANVIDVYIGHLRRKIDDGHAIRLIQTVRGAGYKIATPGP